MLLFQVAHFNIIFQHNATSLHGPQKNKMNERSTHTNTICQVAHMGSLVFFFFFYNFLPLGHFGRRGIVVTCVCPSVRLCVEIFVRAITHHVFELRSPNLHQMCILGPFRTLLKMVLIDLNLQGHLGSKGQNRPKTSLSA